MKDLKMCSFRLETSLFSNFKDFCTRNNITIKETLTKCIDLLLEADNNEQLELELMKEDEETRRNLMERI